LAIGDWLLAIGRWQLAVGNWRFEIGGWQTLTFFRRKNLCVLSVLGGLIQCIINNEQWTIFPMNVLFKL
jgi:hypothetical protein